MKEMGLSDKIGPKVGVILPIGLGNFIMATPALEHLQRVHGKENLSLVALKSGVRVLGEATGWFGKVHYWDPDAQGVLMGLSVLREIRGEKWDSVLNFFPTSHWKFKLFAKLTGAKQVWGFIYSRGEGGECRTSCLPLKPVHDVYQNLRLVSQFLNEPNLQNPKLHFPMSMQHPREEELKVLKYFVCHPGSSDERGMDLKRLAPEKFAEIIKMIHKGFNLQCILIGGPEEENLRQSIAKQVPSLVLDISSSDLSELGSLVQYSQFFLGNDSGLMHIAAALEKKCIVFFGPSDENRSGPFASESVSKHKNLYMGRHLVIRNTSQSIPISKPQQFRLKYEGRGGLDHLEISSVWEQIEGYIKESIYSTS